MYNGEQVFLTFLLGFAMGYIACWVKYKLLELREVGDE